MKSSSEKSKRKSDKKIQFHEEEIKDHEEGHVIKEADTKFEKTDDAEVVGEDDDLDKKLIEAHKNAEVNILRSSSKEIIEDEKE